MVASPRRPIAGPGEEEGLLLHLFEQSNLQSLLQNLQLASLYRPRRAHSHCSRRVGHYGYLALFLCCFSGLLQLFAVDWRQGQSQQISGMQEHGFVSDTLQACFDMLCLVSRGQHYPPCFSGRNEIRRHESQRSWWERNMKTISCRT